MLIKRILIGRTLEEFGNIRVVAQCYDTRRLGIILEGCLLVNRLGVVDLCLLKTFHCVIV